MEFTSTKNGDKLIVLVSGRLDAITAPEFDAECKTWIADGNTNVIADLTALEYISSAGLRSVLTAAKQLKGAQGGLAFCGLSGMVEEVFSVSGFSAMFPLFNSIDEALAG